MRQRLARALSLPEKKMLRETLRVVVSGQGHGSAGLPDDAELPAATDA
jgi:hypothetical protein